MINQTSFGFSRKLFSLVPLMPFFLLAIFFHACTPSPVPISYGKDECEHCRMMITDNKYGAEVVTAKGKIYKFDSVECLIEFALDKNIIGDDNHLFLVTDFSVPEKLIDAKTAFYVHNDNFKSPMGLNVLAFEKEKDFKKFVNESGGKALSWVEVIEFVKQSIM